ncbi:DUF2330 domain-containing protein [Streptomyces justiciae]|uniref:DUF2330 domain-containing protein n=1 Tax=Streptomyces justiciae TaxID=2780140 RepID=UPI0021181617|nr:DUF2330 domain-containing protein [Streptomyces justiciae]MCW8384406.1 DUF2330 domain-containing protein [Streptomyces justiciae]
MVDFLRGRARRRLLAVVLALLATQVGSLVAPAYACGCGAMIPDTARRVGVAREVSVVRWDGRRERIVMRLTVDGDSDRAAWIMPVPHRADVTLGDPALFDELDAATAPVHRTRSHFWPQDGDWPLVSGGGRDAGAPPPGAGRAPGVGVVGRQKLGPFDVARLTATDPDALGGWLADNGFSLPPRLSGALQPYVARRWEYVAIRLAPETTGTPLQGTLDPLSLSFTADEPVYPMRLSRLARTPQSLGLYVLAAHRMEPASAIGGSRPRVTFAGRVTPPRNSPLAELTAGTPFLTAIGQEFPAPSLIDGDHTLQRTAADTPFQQVIYEDRLRTVAGIPAWLLTVAGTLAALTAAVALFVVRRTRRPAQPPTAEPMTPQGR